jgi:hypothetical protein
MNVEEIIRKVYGQATQIGVCPLFTGKERTLEEITALFLSPQGTEYCIRHHFPNIATMRLFKEFGMERYGIYIDAGVVTLTNPDRAVLIGRTSATVNCDTCEMHEVVFMHGAKGTVNATGWSVVRIEAESGCAVIRNVMNNAVIL